MSHQLGFSLQHRYDTRQNGITIDVILRLADRKRRVVAKVDTGASFCIFQRAYGEALGLQIESGQSEWIGTATGRFRAFGHRVTLHTLEIEFETMVDFAEDPMFARNVLGQRGWLDHVQIGIVDYEGLLYLSDYNQLTTQ